LVEGSCSYLLVKQSITTKIIKFLGGPSVIVKPIVKITRVALSLQYNTDACLILISSWVQSHLFIYLLI
jgi:hypothetical protein